jgi:hypothetical protein
MREGRGRRLAALTLGVALVLGGTASAEPPAATTGRFEVLPSPSSLLDDKPMSAPLATDKGREIKPIVDVHPADADVPQLDAESGRAEAGSDGLFLIAEYLLLKPQRGDLDFAIRNATQSGHPDGTIESLVLGTTSSFRVGAGYRLSSQWEVGASYCYLFSRGQGVVTSDPGGTIYATMTSPAVVEQAVSAVGDVRLNYNVADLEVGRRLQLSDNIGVRVFAGGRAGFINQHVSATYNGRDANNAGVYTRVDFDGAGLRVGAEGAWNIGWGFSVWARAAGSMVDGRYQVNQTETNGTASLVNVSDKFEKIVPVTEYGLGVGWERNNIRFRIGYEMTNWSNLVDRPDFVDDVHRGKMVQHLSDLSLNGLSVQLGIGF